MAARVAALSRIIIDLLIFTLIHGTRQYMFPLTNRRRLTFTGNARVNCMATICCQFLLHRRAMYIKLVHNHFPNILSYYRFSLSCNIGWPITDSLQWGSHNCHLFFGDCQHTKLFGLQSTYLVLTVRLVVLSRIEFFK